MNDGAPAQVRKIIAELAYFFIRFIKRLFQMQDGTCRFEPTCSCYTRDALRLLPFHKAVPAIVRRVSRCHPGGGFGYDPVIPASETDVSTKENT